MRRLIGWMGAAAVLWVITLLTTVIFLGLVPHPEELTPQVKALAEVQSLLLKVVTNSIGFLIPVAQFGLIVAILIYASQRIGLLSPGQAGRLKVDTSNVQAVIAIMVIGTFSLVALTGLGESNIANLKDIVLVVVGFYFGTRRREGDAAADAATAGAVAGAAAANMMGGGGIMPPPSDDHPNRPV